MKAAVVAVLVCLGCLQGVVSQGGSEEEAQEWADQYNIDVSAERFDSVDASWNYNTNLTDHNLQISLEMSEKLAAFDKQSAEEANEFEWADFEDETLSREFGKIVDIGEAVLSEDDYNECNNLKESMKYIYSTGCVSNRPGDDDPETCYPLDPDLTNIMATSEDWEELLWAWEGWRDETGKQMPDMYEEFVGYLNQAAIMNGYADNGEYWRSWYEMDGFAEECERLWLEVKPLYDQLHAYVRRKLQERYPDEEFPADGHIPAHILGNMWAQSWGALEPLVRPYPEKSSIDVTDELVNQGYDALGLFVLAEEFFVSLGLIEMPPPFWEHSMIEKPDDGRDVTCHASAWDFYNQVDFRVKQCTEVTHSWLATTHHEMGHVEYYLQYMNQPIQFRRGANPGFHEAIGDVMDLSVNTPDHLYEIGLLPDYDEDDLNDPEVDMNFLMSMALGKIAFLPFGYLIDQWRWDVFAGDSQRDTYNRDWWDQRCKYQGVSPPVTRHESEDFDPGAKYHVPANTPYIRYFVSHILQFQFHEALCEAAGWNGELHRCSIYESLEAGQLIGDMMELGSSMPWPDALEVITGTREMSAEPIIHYFQPLLDWLEAENEGHSIGWNEECPDGVIEGCRNQWRFYMRM